MNAVQNRIAKADRYADAIEANGNPVDEVRVYGDVEWAQVAAAIGEKPPSAETVALILNNLRQRAIARDPFIGLDGIHRGTTVGGARTNPMGG